MNENELTAIVRYVEGWKSIRASEKWRRKYSNNFPHLLFIVPTFDANRALSDLIKSDGMGAIRHVKEHTLQNSSDLISIMQTTKSNSIIFLDDIATLNDDTLRFLAGFMKAELYCFYCSIMIDNLGEFQYGYLFDAAVLMMPFDKCEIIEIGRDKNISESLYHVAKQWYDKRQLKNIITNPFTINKFTSKEHIDGIISSGRPDFVASSYKRTIATRSNLQKQGTFGNFECQDCFRILSKSDANRYSYSERVGWQSGTTRTTSSATSRSGNWSAQSVSGRMRYGQSSSTTNRQGYSRISGRSFYKSQTILICSDCLRVRKDHDIMMLKIFGVLLLILCLIIMIFGFKIS